MKVRKISPSEAHFESVWDFLDCMARGGEIQFRWQGKEYGMVRYGPDRRITFYQAYYPESQCSFDNMERILDCRVGEDRLGDIITKVELIFRSV